MPAYSKYPYSQLTLAAMLLLGFAASAAGELKVIELFTSQGCYSCPAADKLIGEMAAEDDDILSLEFHVDYWDQLQYGSAGSWKDPFSSPKHTLRQYQYNELGLSGRTGVYTPQAIINGVYANVGSKRRAMINGLKVDSPRPVSVGIKQGDDQTVSITVDAESDLDANVYWVSFLKETSTDIPSGENKDKVMKNHNVVDEFLNVATLKEAIQSPLTVAYSGGDNRGCAVIVQSKDQGPILGAARCP